MAGVVSEFSLVEFLRFKPRCNGFPEVFEGSYPLSITCYIKRFSAFRPVNPLNASLISLAYPLIGVVLAISRFSQVLDPVVDAVMVPMIYVLLGPSPVKMCESYVRRLVLFSTNPNPPITVMINAPRFHKSCA